MPSSRPSHAARKRGRPSVGLQASLDDGRGGWTLIDNRSYQIRPRETVETIFAARST
jgi:hypothetical protein